MSAEYEIKLIAARQELGEYLNELRKHESEVHKGLKRANGHARDFWRKKVDSKILSVASELLGVERASPAAFEPPPKPEKAPRWYGFKRFYRRLFSWQ